ncbi:MAG: 6,7-dimethyl-8-ribityllumazine synthase [Candidatus Dormiibacterota bacterium]
MPSTRPEGSKHPLSARVRALETHAGALDATGMRIGIVVSKYNDVVSTPLLEGAVEALERHGATAPDIVIAWVPGAFEIPIAARELAEHGDVEAIVCLGAVIRGDTAHFEYVAGEAARGIASVHASTGVPATFGVLTVDTLEQAMERAGGRLGNKGAEAALAAVEMASLLRSVRRPVGTERRAVS